MTSDGYSDEQLRGFGWLLKDLVDTLGPAASAGAVLLSRDGLLKAYAGSFEEVARDNADTLAATASSLYSLGVQFGKGSGLETNGVRRVLVDGHGFFGVVMSAGYGSVLVVRAADTVDSGLVGFEMNRLIQRMAEHLATPDRRSDVPAASQ
ncbi:roadblock/LC7 domain-containing protein [Streptomyces sp. NPDC056672]|uniref:roadblock/LC7 domain-containing protein n=1 Tax=Streptomyces sp. NPDC056672 TaxID=3345906 RepID=UPI00368BF3EC